MNIISEFSGFSSHFTLLEILDYFAQKNGANLLAMKDGAKRYNILVFRYVP